MTIGERKMKVIIVQWIKTENFYGAEMRIIKSDHPKFIERSRFDFGFFQIATSEGYTIISLPPEEI